MQREAQNPSLFDPLLLRSRSWISADSIDCYVCKNAKIIVTQKKEKKVIPPLELWARIFQWLGPPLVGKQWRVFWFPADNKRLLPPSGHPVISQHINGGYSIPCRHDTIVVYRQEEATRVLIHEILHASCCDVQAPLPIKEANTETWAELFLVALLSCGSPTKAAELWAIQSQWIADQNAILRRSHKVHSENQYAWRYTVGREQILDSLNIPLPSAKLADRTGMSGRFTSPELCY